MNFRKSFNVLWVFLTIVALAQPTSYLYAADRKIRLSDCVDTVTDYGQIVDAISKAREQHPELKQYQPKHGRLTINRDRCHYVYRERSSRLHGKVNAVWLNSDAKIVRWIAGLYGRDSKNVWSCEKNYNEKQIAGFIKDARSRFLLPKFIQGSEIKSGKTKDDCEFWYQEKYLKDQADVESWVSMNYFLDQNGEIFRLTEIDANSQKLFSEEIKLKNISSKELNEKLRALKEKYKTKDL